MKKMIAVVGIVLLAGLSTFAKAEDRKMTASFLPGLSIPVGGLYASNKDASGSFNDGMGSSFATAVAVDYQIQDSLAVGMEIGHDWNHAMKQTGSGYDGNKTSLWQFTPYAKYSFKPIGQFTPYGILGIGVYSFHQDALNYNGAELYAARNSSHLGFNIGGGATYELAKEWEIGLDVRWHHVFSNIQMHDMSDNSINYIALNNITPSLKLQYNFSL